MLQTNGGSFCVDLTAATLLRRGASHDKVMALSHRPDSCLYDDRERIALDYAEAVTRSDQQTDDEQFVRLRDCFSDNAIVELTGLIVFQNMSSKFNAALGVPPQWLCSPPAERIGPAASAGGSG